MPAAPGGLQGRLPQGHVQPGGEQPAHGVQGRHQHLGLVWKDTASLPRARFLLLCKNEGVIILVQIFISFLFTLEDTMQSRVAGFFALGSVRY